MDESHSFHIRKNRQAEVVSQAKPRPNRLGMGPVDAKGLADQQGFGDLPARPSGGVPPLLRNFRIELVDLPPRAGVAAPGTVVAQHEEAPGPEHIVAGWMMRQLGESSRV